MPRVLVDLLSYTGTKGGMETYTRELYSAIGQFDHEFEFIAFASREGIELDLSWFPGEVIASGISGENRFEWAWGEITQVGKKAHKLAVDLVHSPATLGPLKTSMPTVVTMHDMLYWSHPEYMSTPLYTTPVKWMEKAAARNATRIITISDESAEEIIKYLHVARSSLDVIPLAGNPLPGVDRTLASGQPPFVLAMGNRRPHKNWGALIRAIALIPAERRPRLVITGGRGSDPLSELVTSSGMTEWVELRGWVDEAEVRHLFSTATMLAIPSLAEGFSLPTIEAMSVGIPVILSDIGVHRSVGGTAASFFDPHDDASIARAIDEIASDEDLRRTMAAAGTAQAALFSWDRTAKETLASFRQALS